MLMLGNAVILFILILLNSSVKTIFLLLKIKLIMYRKLQWRSFPVKYDWKECFLKKKKSQGALPTHRFCNPFGHEIYKDFSYI